MPLKTVVKVGNISNLSDARYCSGMGVDMLGFRVLESQQNHISPKLFQEIRGWVTGPKIVAEIYGLTSADQLAQIIENYAPDYFELTADEFNAFQSQISLPCIVSGFPGENPKIAFHLVTEGEVTRLQDRGNLLVRPATSANVLALIALPQVSGLAIDGTSEERPGFKDYADLADILEKLDEY